MRQCKLVASPHSHPILENKLQNKRNMWMISINYHSKWINYVIFYLFGDVRCRRSAWSWKWWWRCGGWRWWRRLENYKSLMCIGMRIMRWMAFVCTNLLADQPVNHSHRNSLIYIYKLKFTPSCVLNLLPLLKLALCLRDEDNEEKALLRLHANAHIAFA